MLGRDLAAREPNPDEVFTGLFPEIDATTAWPDCSCEECREADQGGAGEVSLPVLRPEPDDVLAAAAAASPLVQRAVALAGWVGPGRSVTPSRMLRPAEAVEAVIALGLDRPVLPSAGGTAGRGVGGVAVRPGHGDAPGARSAKDVPALHAVWCAAVAAGLIEVRGQKAYPGRGWRCGGTRSSRVTGWRAGPGRWRSIYRLAGRRLAPSAAGSP